MSEMVERVTEAICQAERDWLDSERTISLQEATAIAAIKEMRNMTTRMVVAGAASIVVGTSIGESFGTT
jgi:hypothetical protein